MELAHRSRHADLERRRYNLVPRGTALHSAQLNAILKAHGFEPIAEQLHIVDEAWYQYKRASKIMEEVEALPRLEREVEMGLLRYQMAREDSFRYLALLRAANGEILNYVYPKKKSIEFKDDNVKDAFKTFADIVRAVGADKPKE